MALPDIILKTKLYVPAPHPNLVARSRLVDRLNRALRLNHKLILVSALPGAGKTTLLSEWLHNWETNDNLLPEHKSQKKIVNRQSKIVNRTAWLALDDEDNNPHRLLAYGIAALQTIRPEAGQATLAQLQDIGLQTLTPEALVGPLINEAAAIGSPLIFVLDDYHVINNPVIHHSIAFLLDNLPAHVTLVIATRAEPPLPLARLRGRGRLTELANADLRFTPAEAVTFLNQIMGLNLSSDEVETLEARTEGWIAGLQMAALSMQGLDDTTGFVKAFAGSHRHILDYLLEEVLNRQPVQVQQFLLRTSILDRLCAPLCDAVLNEAEAQKSATPTQEIIESLEQANLFIIPLDDERRWYRYHHLFADLLRRRLAERPPAEGVAALHRRASRWHERNGLAVEAMRHALAAVDVERVVKLARQQAATRLSRSELATLLSWLDTLPQMLDRSRPRLLLLRAWAMVLTGRLQAVEQHLQEAERELRAIPSLETDIKDEAALLRATVAYFQRDMPRAVALYQKALEQLSPNNLFLQGIVLQCLGSAQSWCGQVIEAAQAFGRAATVNQSTGNKLVSLIATWNLAQLQVEQGHLRRAGQIYREALDQITHTAPAQQESLRPFAGRLYIGQAELNYQWHQLAEATRLVQEGLTLGEQAQDAGTMAGGYITLARLKQAQGEAEKAFDLLQQAQQLAQRYNGPRYLAGQAALCQARLWLVQENYRAVANWIQEQDISFDPLPDSIPYLREELYLLLARLLLAQQQQGQQLAPAVEPLAAAAKILLMLLPAARESKRVGRVIEVLNLQALVWQAQQKKGQALATLEESLLLAEPEGYVRLFVDEGPAMAQLLHQAAAQGVASKYVAKLLAVFAQSSAPGSPTASPSPLLEPLSDRELEILQLMATGLSNKELADELVVTVGTVKWHLNNVYGKLAVRNRTEAVARARELGLL